MRTLPLRLHQFQWRHNGVLMCVCVLLRALHWVELIWERSTSTCVTCASFCQPIRITSTTSRCRTKSAFWHLSTSSPCCLMTASVCCRPTRKVKKHAAAQVCVLYVLMYVVHIKSGVIMLLFMFRVYSSGYGSLISREQSSTRTGAPGVHNHRSKHSHHHRARWDHPHAPRHIHTLIVTRNICKPWHKTCNWVVSGTGLTGYLVDQLTIKSLPKWHGIIKAS